MSDSMFRNLKRGAALQSLAGFKDTTLLTAIFGKWGDFVQLGLDRIESPEGEVLEEGKRNQFVYLVAKDTIRVKEKFKLLVSVNLQLLEAGTTPALFLIDEADKVEKIRVPIHLRKDLDISKLEWLVRVHVIY